MWKKVSKFKYLSLDIVLWKIGGYICDFEVYTGKDSDPNPDGDEEDKQLGHSYNVVLGLLRNNNLFGKGYTVYTDNHMYPDLLSLS
jgi:hypothetical protein